jgi:type 1 fimbria pilin
MMQRFFNHAPRCIQLFALLLLAIIAFGWAPRAAATSCTGSSATLSFPGTVTVPTNAAVGSTLATGSASMSFTCTALSKTNTPATIQAGQNLATLDSTNNPAGPGITFATGVSGLAVLVTASPVQATSESGSVNDGPTSTAGYVPGSISCASNNCSGTVTASYTATLIKTGPIAPGTIPQTNLIPFWWYIPGNGNGYAVSMSLNANLILPSIALTVPSCTLTAGSQNITVTLPGVPASSLSTAGQVGGRTGFSIAVTGCPSTVKSITTYFYGANIDTTTGNLTNNGSANNVEVQLLNGSGGSAAAFSPITLNAAGAQATAQGSSVFNVSGGNATLNYYAQYIASGGAATAGSVSTTVTFTIAYP